MDWVLRELAHSTEALSAFLTPDLSRIGEPDIVVRLVLQVLLLVGSAYFSGSETALFSLSRLDLQKLRRERNRHSDALHELLDHPRRLIISILCGNELVNIASAANMAGILVVLYGPERAGVATVLVMIPLLLLLGEVTPKTIAVSAPVTVSTRIVAAAMTLWVGAGARGRRAVRRRHRRRCAASHPGWVRRRESAARRHGRGCGARRIPENGRGVTCRSPSVGGDGRGCR